MANTDIIMPVQPRSATLPRVRTLTFADLNDALKKGFDDFWAMPTHVVFLALLYPLAGLIISGLTYDNDTIELLYPVAAGFALLGPIAAIWMYELSRRREMSFDTSWRHAFDVFKSPSLPSIAALAFLLLALFVVWIACAQAIYFANFGIRKIASIRELAQLVATTREGWNLFVYGNLVGLVFAAVAATVSVISFPLLLDRNVGFSAAVATSIAVVVRQPARHGGVGADRRRAASGRRHSLPVRPCGRRAGARTRDVASLQESCGAGGRRKTAIHSPRKGRTVCGRFPRFALCVLAGEMTRSWSPDHDDRFERLSGLQPAAGGGATKQA